MSDSATLTEPRRWTIGEITVTAFIETDFRSNLDELQYEFTNVDIDALKSLPWIWDGWFGPGDTMGGYIQIFAIEAGGKKYILDPGIGNDKPRAMEDFRIHTDVLDRLTAAGFGPDDIDGVFYTHLHIDHVGWNTRLVDGEWVPTFPRATHYFVDTEYEHWKAFAEDPNSDDIYDNEFAAHMVDGTAVYTDSVAPIVEAGLYELIAGDAEIAPGIRLVPSPGHTPGHASVLLESNGEKAVITGDSMHAPFQIAYPEISTPLDTDQELSARSRKALVDWWGKENMFVIGTHFGGPVAGRVVSYGDRYGLERV